MIKEKEFKKLTIKNSPRDESEAMFSANEISISISKYQEHPQMTLAHEFGHVFTARKCSPKTYRALATQDLLTIYFIEPKEKSAVIRNEILAWRFAKAICKPIFWNEEEAIKSIMTYCKSLMLDINEKRLRILPLTRDFISMEKLYK